MVQKLKFVVCIITILNFLFAVPLSAQNSRIYNDKWLDDRYDWVLYVESSKLENYLIYKPSQLAPLTDLKISYRVNPRLAQGKTRFKQPYENLWYHDATPVGCHRFCSSLPFQQGWQGAICVMNESDDVNIDALANAAVRLLLDVALKQGVTLWVLVPPDMVHIMSSALGRFGFSKSTEDMVTAPNGVFVIVSSGVEADRQFLRYHP